MVQSELMRAQPLVRGYGVSHTSVQPVALPTPKVLASLVTQIEESLLKCEACPALALRQLQRTACFGRPPAPSPPRWRPVCFES